MLKKILTCIAVLLLSASHSIGSFAQSAGEQELRNIRSSGAQRAYVLYLPSNPAATRLPLVLNFHGSGSSPELQQAQTDFISQAEMHGFALVYPMGEFTNLVTSGSWNANLDEGVDDVQYTLDIIEDVAGIINLDRQRIYATGFSGGARMTSRLACELSDVLAAAAPVSGLQYPDDCVLKRSIPVLSFHSLDDRVNNYVWSENSPPYWRMNVETALDRWRQANNCSLTSSSHRLSQYVNYYHWSDCAGSAEMQFYQLGNGGHTWPDSPTPASNKDISASELIWNFFSSHSLP